jgi:glutamate-1-semialdehyde 2,1-aminomutase
VKLARAKTGRKLVAFPGNHPFYSYDDWFIGTTAAKSGVPDEASRMTLRFPWNDFAALEKLFAEHGRNLACVMTEGFSAERPAPGFLEKTQELCKKHGALFIMDEMVNGFRHAKRGAQEMLNLKPDMATYGKAIGNGHSVAALVGPREVMDLGGIDNGKPRVFLVSTTHGAEAHSLAALVAVIDTFEKNDVIGRLWQNGERLMGSFDKTLKRHGLDSRIKLSGFPPNLWMAVTDASGKSDMVLRTLMMQELIARGVMSQGLAYATTWSHTPDDLKVAEDTFEDVCSVVGPAVANGSYAGMLKGEPAKPVFRPIN